MKTIKKTNLNFVLVSGILIILFLSILFNIDYFVQKNELSNQQIFLLGSSIMYILYLVEKIILGDK